MFSNFEQVRAFHEKFRLPVGSAPREMPQGLYDEDRADALRQLLFAEKVIQRNRLPNDVAWGRVQMMIEELREFAIAVEAGDLEGQADGLVDLVYFALGTAVMMGLPWEKLFDEVHRANMEKELVADREESARLNKLDVKKPVGWAPPDVKGVLRDAGFFQRAIS